jgi:hypothetical protein
MVEIGHNTYMESDLIISTEYNEPTLSINISQLDSMNETMTYNFKLISTYNGQVDDLIDDAMYMYDRDKSKTL